MSNKNPFEIRLELLKMSREYLDQQWQINVNLAHQILDKVVDKSIKDSEDVAALWNKYVPAFYSIDDITKKANELYSFVSGTNPTK